MRVEFKLVMKNAEISDVFVEYFELKWREELSPVQLAGRFNTWLYDDDFISSHLPDLNFAGHCLLSISPL